MRKIFTLISFTAIIFSLHSVSAQSQTYRSEAAEPILVLYENADFTPPKKTFWTCESANIQNMRYTSTDGGRKDFNDKVTGATWNLPKGTEIVLYENRDYKGWNHVLSGKGKNSNFGGAMNDSVSSIRCRRAGQN